jgi:hypothetical protein
MADEQTTTTTTDTKVDGTTTVTAADWYGKITDAETKGYFENRGLHVKSIDEALLETAKAHREATKLIGVPQDQLLRIPKADAPEAEVQAFRTKLNIPSSPADYDFTAVKKADGTSPDAAFIDNARALAATLQLPKDRAPELAANLLKAQESAAAETSAVKTAELEKQRNELKANWGDNYAANEVVAKQAGAALLEATGMKPEEIAQATAALEETVGYARTMELFRQIGMKTGEGRFVQNNNPLNGGLMTRDAAQARLTELKQDTAWRDRYLNGDAAARRESDSLHAIIAG